MFCSNYYLPAYVLQKSLRSHLYVLFSCSAHLEQVPPKINAKRLVQISSCEIDICSNYRKQPQNEFNGSEQTDVDLMFILAAIFLHVLSTGANTKEVNLIAESMRTVTSGTGTVFVLTLSSALSQKSQVQHLFATTRTRGQFSFLFGSL